MSKTNLARPRQYTDLLMLPITGERASYLAEQLTARDDAGAQQLIELICGLAAIEDHEARQRATYEAVQDIYMQTSLSAQALQIYVARIWESAECGQ